MTVPELCVALSELIRRFISYPPVNSVNFLTNSSAALSLLPDHSLGESQIFPTNSATFCEFDEMFTCFASVGSVSEVLVDVARTLLLDFPPPPPPTTLLVALARESALFTRNQQPICKIETDGSFNTCGQDTHARAYKLHLRIVCLLLSSKVVTKWARCAHPSGHLDPSPFKFLF